jgi:hypothetical protein
MSSDLKPTVVIIDFEAGTIVKTFFSAGLDLSFDATSLYNSASFYSSTYDYFFFGKTRRLYTQGLANEVGYIASLITGRPFSLMTNYNEITFNENQDQEVDLTLLADETFAVENFSATEDSSVP